MKTTGTVKFTLDPKNPPKLTRSQAARPGAIKDEDIDLSDIPNQGGLARAKPHALACAETKRQITLRIDADVLTCFKATGAHYQTRMNAVMRSYMTAQRPVSSKSTFELRLRGVDDGERIWGLALSKTAVVAQRRSGLHITRAHWLSGLGGQLGLWPRSRGA